MRTLLAVCLLCLVPFVAIGKDAAHENVTFDSARFEQQRAEIEKAMGGETYRELSAEQRTSVIDALDEMQRLLDKSDGADMREEDRIQLFNAQEQVNTLLTQAADDSRVICKRETKMGSHMKVNICKTIAERRREREGNLQDVRNRPALPVENRG